MNGGDGANAGTPASAETGWLRISDGLIAGIHHALNNRMAALGAAGQVLEADLSPDHPLSGILSGEVQRLENTVTLLRLLTEGDAAPQPIQVTDTLKDVHQLFAIHHSMRELSLEINCQAGLLPLWTRPSGLLRAILLCLAVAADRGNRGQNAVNLEVSGDDSFVYIDVTGPTEGTEVEGEAILGEGGSAGIDPLAKQLGGTFDFDDGDGAVRLRLTLPTLIEVRRRERTVNS